MVESAVEPLRLLVLYTLGFMEYEICFSFRPSGVDLGKHPTFDLDPFQCLAKRHSDASVVKPWIIYPGDFYPMS
jgi:hypothetical protein